MKWLSLFSSLNDEVIAAIASCVDKIDRLLLNVRDVTASGWEILSTAINNRLTPVS